MNKNIKRISLFGNPLIEKDSLPLKILSKLRKRFPDIEFVVEDPTETLNPPQEEWWIIDSAEGIDEVKLIEDISKFETSKSASVHDYDLAFELNLLKKLGKLPKLIIIAIPFDMSEKEAFTKISKLLRKGKKLS